MLHGEDPIKPSDPIVGPPRRSVSSAFDIDAQYALEVHAEAFVTEHYTSGRSQLEAKRYIREVSVFIAFSKCPLALESRSGNWGQHQKNARKQQA